jgi:ABC-2 type transport system permease protein
MKRTLAIANRIMKELLRDKRSLALIFVAPLVVLTLMSYIFSVNATTNVTIGTVDVPQAIVQNLEKTKHIKVKTYMTENAAHRALKAESIDTAILFDDHVYHVKHANTDVSKTALAKASLQAAITTSTITGLTKVIPPELQGKQSAPKIENTYQYGSSKSTFFNKMEPILMGFFVFFFVFLISGMALLTERTSGTLDRLLATPVKRSEIVFGYLLSYGIVAILQTLLIVVFTVKVLDVEVAGSIWLVILTTALLALVALSMGIFLSTFAKSEFQMVQFIPVVVIPQIFFSGLISLDAMATWAQWLANVLPMKYAASALTEVILNGKGLVEIAPNLLVLIGFSMILTVGNIIGLKRYRKV